MKYQTSTIVKNAVNDPSYRNIEIKRLSHISNQHTADAMAFLHSQTLFLVLIATDFVIGLFFVAAWYSRRDRVIYFWLGSACFSSIVGCILLILRDHIPPIFSIALANFLILLATGMLWGGIQSFEGKERPLHLITLGAVAWITLCAFPIFFESLRARTIFISLTAAVYYFAIALTIARSWRQHRQMGHAIAIFTMVMHAVIIVSRIAFTTDSTGMTWAAFADTNWVKISIVESIVNLILMALAVTTMERDRAENQQRIAASTDFLTGTFTRGAFMNAAAQWVDEPDQQATLMLFDLDHFKRINDTYGHATGDMALVAFAKMVKQKLETANLIASFNLSHVEAGNRDRRSHARGSAIFGRVGGEEFASLLRNVTLQQACGIANDILQGTRNLDVRSGGQRLELSVSTGIVRAADASNNLDAMLAAADRALYRAKRNGRNRFELAGPTPPEPQSQAQRAC